MTYWNYPHYYYIEYSAPNLDAPKLSWKAVRQPTTHQQTLGIIMVTLALKRYHPIWFTSGPPLLHTDPSHLAPSAASPPPIQNQSQGIANTSTAPAARANPRKRKHQSPPTTLGKDEDTSQMQLFPP